MKKTVVVLLAAVGLFCSAGTARIDLISGNAGLRAISTAPGVSGKNMNWLPPEKAKRMLYFQQRNNCDEWSTMKFSFVADRDATVRITLRGPYRVTPQKKRLPAAVFYDELRIDDKSAPNGGFEPGENAGRRWNHLIADRGLAASGNGVLRVTHDDPESFSLVEMYRSRVPRIYIQSQFPLLLLRTVQEPLSDSPALRLSPDKNSRNIILIQSDKSLDLIFIFIYIYIHFRLGDHFLYRIVISFPVLRRDKIMGFQIRIQPDLRNSVNICYLHFSDHTQTSLSNTKSISLK